MCGCLRQSGRKDSWKWGGQGARLTVAVSLISRYTVELFLHSVSPVSSCQNPNHFDSKYIYIACIYCMSNSSPYCFFKQLILAISLSCYKINSFGILIGAHYIYILIYKVTFEKSVQRHGISFHLFGYFMSFNIHSLPIFINAFLGILSLL